MSPAARLHIGHSVQFLAEDRTRYGKQTFGLVGLASLGERINGELKKTFLKTNRYYPISMSTLNPKSVH